MSGLSLFESGILQWVQSHLWGSFDGFAAFLSMLGEYGWVWIVPTLALILCRRTRRAGHAAGIALLLGFVVCNLLLKNAVARVRPYEAFPFLQALGKIPADTSFPSGHSSSAFAAASAMAWSLKKRAGIPALCLAALISMSRIYLCVHYPTDVLAGAMLGILCGRAGVKLSRKMRFPDKIAEKQSGV